MTFARRGLPNAYPQVKLEKLKPLPVALVSKNKIEEINKLVTMVILKKSSNESELTQEERKIDNLVYVLYDLTYDEVKVVEPDFPMTEAEYNEFKQQHQDK